MPNLSFVGALLAAPVYACLLPSSCHSWITSYPLLNKERVGTCAGVRCFQRKSLAKKSLRPGSRKAVWSQAPPEGRMMKRRTCALLFTHVGLQ
jgi:hypothetical protein